MTIEHRKCELLNQLFRENISNLVASLAQAHEEVTALKLYVAQFEAEKAATKSAVTPSEPSLAPVPPA